MSAATTSNSVTLAKNEVGPVVIGALISMGFWGPLAIQSLTYFRASQSDPLTWRKYMVGFVVACTTLVVAMECNLAYANTIHSGDADFLFEISWRNFAYLVPSIPVGFTVQIFYGWQIRELTRMFAPALLVWALAVIASGAQIASATWGGLLRNYTLWTPITPVVYVWLVGTAVNDLVIATILVLYLRTKRTGFRGTDDVINRIAQFAVQTSALTALCATLDIILFASFKNNNHYIFNFPLYPLYANCLVAALNARSEWFDRGGSGRSDPLDTKVASNERRRRQKGDVESGGVRIHTTQNTVVAIEDEEGSAPSETYQLHTFRKVGDVHAVNASPRQAKTEIAPNDSLSMDGSQYPQREFALKHSPSEHSVENKGHFLA